MKLSAAIMAHPARSGWVERLLAELDRDVPVSWDAEGPPSGNADRVWRNARSAWLMHDPAADWHVLIQDDAIVSRDLLAGLEQALEHVPPDAVVSPYLGTSRNVAARWGRMAAQADERSAVWIRTERVAWGVCLAVPVGLIPDLIEYADRRAGKPDDMRVSAWAQRRDMEVWYPWPSLSDHRQVPSLTKHRAADRVARRFHNGSALDVNWGGPVVTDPMMIRRKGPRSGPRARQPVR